MSEIGGLDSFDTQGVSEASEQSQEQFRDQIRQSQAAAQQQQKDEGKARQKDDQLAKIIVQFLAQPSNTDLFLLISRCVGQDIPSEVIIAVLSLTDRTAFVEMENILKDSDPSSLPVPTSNDSIHSLSEGQMKAIEQWLSHINLASAKKPFRTLESLLVLKKVGRGEDPIREISPSFIQLSAFILRNYLAMQSTQVDYENLHDFMQSAYLKMIQNLRDMVADQKQLT